MRAVSFIPALLLVASCSSTSGPNAVTSTQSNLPAAPAIEARDPERTPERARVPMIALPEGALVEGPSSRDPFRAYPAEPPAPPLDTRPRKARRIPIEDLKLVALVTHTDVPRAMLVDPSGKGYVVTPGELVGRPETEGGRTASFRVDRIREGDVVLVREVANDPTGVAATRVLALAHAPLLQADD